MRELLRARRVTFVLLALMLMVGSILAGCSNNKEGSSEPAEFRFVLGSEPSSLDPALMTDSTSSIIASGLYEGLMRLNPAGEPENAIAKEVKISDDGKTYTFKLRDDAKWSNGEPVTAHDFEYSWKRALDPATASEYAYMLYYLENGEKYNAGEITDASQVGVKALDDYTLEAKLYTAAPYFISLVAHYTYWPVNKTAVDGKPEWAAEASTMVTNGPFLLSEWKHEDRLILKKNPDYFNKKKVGFDTVTISLVEDNNTVYNLFETDEIDWIGAQAGAVVNDLTGQLIAEGKATVREIASVYYYLFNTKKAPFDNVKIRKAFSMAINRQAIIDNVTKANQTPAYGLVPSSIAGTDGKSYREIYPDNYFKENVEEAKTLLADGMKEAGLSKLPELTLLYNTSDGHKAIAEAIADMWRTNLGVEVTLANQEFATFLETRKAGQFDIARSGWGADFNHALNFTYDLIHPKSGNNDGKYDNEKVGQLLDDSILADNEKDRLSKIAEAEKIAIQEDMAVLPIYYYTTVYMEKDGFEDVVSDYAGHLDWAFGKKK